MKAYVIVGIVATFALVGCGSPPRYAYVKEGASHHTTQSDLSKCEYQIKLQKTPQGEQNDLRKLCMEGEGYRLKRVN